LAGRLDEAKRKLVVALLPEEADDVEAAGEPSLSQAWDEDWHRGNFHDPTMIHFGIRRS
jgi:hypothetical protein